MAPREEADAGPPPYRPETRVVDIGSKKVVVVRVDPTFAPRPVLRNGTIHVRNGASTVGADRYIVEALFAEQSSTLAGGSLPARPQIDTSPLESERPQLSFYLRTVIPLVPSSSRGLMIADLARNELLSTLTGSKLQKWLIRHDATWKGLQIHEWRQRGWNTSTRATAMAAVTTPSRHTGLIAQAIVSVDGPLVIHASANFFISRLEGSFRQGQGDSPG